MDPDDEDALILRGLALAAAVLVNFGRGNSAATIIDEAREYEAYLLTGVTPGA